MGIPTMAAAGTAVKTAGPETVNVQERCEIMQTDMMKKVPVREQEPLVRAANFDEVCLGYNKEEAEAEAARCLNCKTPAVSRDALSPLTSPASSPRLKRAM